MVAYAILINYYHKTWNRLSIYNLPATMPGTFVSVIIAARNEESNIVPLLKSLSTQSYPHTLYEVIIIDDASTDNTWNLLQEAALNGMQVTNIRMEEGGGKKKAIATGISKARGTLIVTTDADCRFHERWLQCIAAYYEQTGAKFIAAPVKITGNLSLVGIFQTLDFITLQGITAAAVSKRMYSMCNGANLAYERLAFEEVKGFEGIDKLPTGDDMLLMHKIYVKYPTQVFYLKAKEAIVASAAVTTWKAFFHQRIRWASKADSYDDKRIFRTLLLVYLVNICFLVTAIASFWHNIWLFFALLLLLAKVLIEFPFVHAAAIFFEQRKLMVYFPFLQPLHILYTIIAGWLGKFGKYEWKGRTITKNNKANNQTS